MEGMDTAACPCCAWGLLPWHAMHYLCMSLGVGLGGGGAGSCLTMERASIRQVFMVKGKAQRSPPSFVWGQS